MPIITSLFGGHAPFLHLQKHMRSVRSCARLVVPLVEAAIAEDKARVAELAEQISTEESMADSLKHELRVHLPRSLFLPVDRRDLLEVLHQQDAIADTAEDIAGMLVDREMTVPEAMQETLLAMVKRCVEVVDLAGEIIEQMDELLEVGFRGRTAERVEQLANALNEAEQETDDLERELGRKLFHLEGVLDPVSVIFWYRLIEWIGDLADHAEKVGNNIRLIIAR